MTQRPENPNLAGTESSDPLATGTAEQVAAARKAAKYWSIAAVLAALFALGAGWTQNIGAAFLFGTAFIPLAIAANYQNQNARRLRDGQSPPKDLGRQVGEGLLMAALLAVLLPIIAAVWIWHLLGQWHG